MIDKNGRLFGKISIIDVLVVALVLIAGVFFAARFLTSMGSPIVAGGATDELLIKFYAEEVNDFVADGIKQGDAVKEFAQYANFGTVVDVDKADSITWVSDFDGIIGSSSKEGYYSVTVTMRAPGRITDVGFELDGTNFFVGKTVILQVGSYGFQGRISGVSKVTESSSEPTASGTVSKQNAPNDVPQDESQAALLDVPDTAYGATV